MSDSQIPAGWYDDPAGDASKKRYWDGAQWTEQLMDASAFAVPAPAADAVSPVVSADKDAQAVASAAAAVAAAPVAAQGGQETFQAAPVQAAPQAQAAPQPTAAPVNPYATEQTPASVSQPMAQGVPTQTYPGAPAQQYPGAPAPMYVPVPQQADNSGQAIAALVLGIVGLFVPWLLALLGYICGVLAIVFGMRAKNSSKKNLAIAGIVLGIITLLFSVASSAIGVLLVSSSYYYY